MFKRLSGLIRGRSAKAENAAGRPPKAVAAELEDVAAEMGEAAAEMKKAATHMNQAVGVPVPAAPAPQPAPAPSAPPPAAEAKPPAPSREEIIRQALAVRRDRARDLEGLPAAERQRLRTLAEKMLLGGTGDKAPPAAGKPPRRRDH